MRLTPSVSVGIPLSASLLMFASAVGAQAPVPVQPTAATSASTTPADQVAQPSKSLIRQAQRELQKKGYSPGPHDGILGPRTQTAIKGYQQAEGLPVTSLLDQATTKQLGLREERRAATPERIREVQKALMETGHDPGPIDGVLGPRTKTALRQYASAPPPQVPTAAQAIISRFRRGNERAESP
jgi:peptidoglycan hydrolase-like protein with peptidoglycan-binding domain